MDNLLIKCEKKQSAKRRLLFLCGLSILFFLKTEAQPSAKLDWQEITFGYSIVSEQLPEGYPYQPLFLTARFGIYNFPSKKRAQFSVFGEPQFTFHDAPSSFANSFELGINFGVRYQLPFSDKNGLLASISAGPHHLSLETTLQARGFLFSDNFEVGYYHQINEQWRVTVKPRFRHLSNAGLQSPNIGIDNFFLMVGVFSVL
ncbi:MAG: acyloxyacyl hydrolase [Bacteroidota bacterium]